MLNRAMMRFECRKTPRDRQHGRAAVQIFARAFGIGLAAAGLV
jgi:hypothetical protein